jgi:GDP-L-fucose synthase
MEKLLVTGGRGLVGSSINAEHKIGREFDLISFEETQKMFEEYRPTKVIHCAGKVGGVGGNMNHKGEYFYDNIMINTNVIESARRNGVEKLVSFLSTCVFPDNVQYPLTESKIHLGEPHSSNYPYAYAKRMADIQIRAYREQYGFNTTVLLPANLYGPYDNFHLENSHVIPALIRKFIAAKESNSPTVEVWGTGVATREFLYVGDTVKAIIDAMACNETGPFNLGTGVETSIKELNEAIAKLVGYEGEIVWDTTRPDGQPKRFYDMSKFKETFGYVPNTTLEDGLKETIEWYNNNKETARL